MASVFVVKLPYGNQQLLSADENPPNQISYYPLVPPSYLGFQ